MARKPLSPWIRSRVGDGGFHRIAGDIWIIRQNVCNRVTMLETAEYGIDGYSRASNDWCAALDGRIGDNEWIALRSNHGE